MNVFLCYCVLLCVTYTVQYCEQEPGMPDCHSFGCLIFYMSADSCMYLGLVLYSAGSVMLYCTGTGTGLLQLAL